MKIHVMLAASLSVSLSAFGKPELVSSMPPATNPAPVALLVAQSSVPTPVQKPAPAKASTAPGNAKPPRVDPDARAKEQARNKKEYQEVIMNSPHASSKEQLIVIEEQMRKYGYKTK